MMMMTMTTMTVKLKVMGSSSNCKARVDFQPSLLHSLLGHAQLGRDKGVEDHHDYCHVDYDNFGGDDDYWGELSEACKINHEYFCHSRILNLKFESYKYPLSFSRVELSIFSSIQRPL